MDKEEKMNELCLYICMNHNRHIVSNNTDHLFNSESLSVYNLT